MRPLVAIVVAVLACGKGGGGGAGSNVPVAGSAVALVGSAGSAVAAGSSAGSAGTANGSADPKQCAEPCLFLTRVAIADYPSAYQAACGKTKTELGFDDCSGLDYVRNCIYASHGKVYTKKKWKKQFEKKSWYTPDPSFKETALSALEKANIKELYHRGKACKKGVHVSAADDKRLSAWFTAFTAHTTHPKKSAPPTPKVLLDDDGKDLTGPAFLAALEHARAGFVDTAAGSHDVDLVAAHATKSYVALDSYPVTDGTLEPLLAKVPGDHAKLRIIQVDFDLRDTDTEEASVNEGIYVYFIYDATDALVAMTFASYLLD